MKRLNVNDVVRGMADAILAKLGSDQFLLKVDFGEAVEDGGQGHGLLMSVVVVFEENVMVDMGEDVWKVIRGQGEEELKAMVRQQLLLRNAPGGEFTGDDMSNGPINPSVN